MADDGIPSTEQAMSALGTTWSDLDQIINQSERRALVGLGVTKREHVRFLHERHLEQIGSSLRPVQVGVSATG